MDDGSGLARRAFLKGLLGTAAGAALTPALGCREPLVTPGELRVSQFRWTPEQGDDALDELQPFAVHRLARPGVG